MIFHKNKINEIIWNFKPLYIHSNETLFFSVFLSAVLGYVNCHVYSGRKCIFFDIFLLFVFELSCILKSTLVTCGVVFFLFFFSCKVFKALVIPNNIANIGNMFHSLLPTALLIQCILVVVGCRRLVSINFRKCKATNAVLRMIEKWFPLVFSKTWVSLLLDEKTPKATAVTIFCYLTPFFLLLLVRQGNVTNYSRRST